MKNRTMRIFKLVDIWLLEIKIILENEEKQDYRKKR